MKFHKLYIIRACHNTSNSNTPSLLPRAQVTPTFAKQLSKVFPLAIPPARDAGISWLSAFKADLEINLF
jgi:hypothetical protein